MTVVLPSGEVVELGSRFGEHDGYDLRGAFIGSEGCFGLALDITVKLTQRPQTVRTLLADFMSVDEAARVTSAIIASGIVPAALEFMDGPTIRVVEESIYAAGYPKDAEAVLLIELDGLEAGVSADLEIVRRVCLDGGARNVKVARDEAERLKLWQGRKKAFGAMGRIASHLIVQDAVIPRTRLSEILEKIHGISEKYGVLVCNVFHAGDGNLHPNIAYSADDPGESERVHKAMTEIMNTCIAAGGSITGEHGVGLDKMGYMESIFSEPSLNAMCELRGVFDPNRRANPGKVVPIHSCKEWNAVASARGISEPVSSLSAEPARPSAR
jgi:glycolate oxidase subunit GlcD